MRGVWRGLRGFRLIDCDSEVGGIIMTMELWSLKLASCCAGELNRKYNSHNTVYMTSYSHHLALSSMMME